MDKTIEAAINKQINHELTASYAYFAMSAYFSSISLDGFAEFMMRQREEELAHAKRLYDYMMDRGGTGAFPAIAEARTAYDGVQDVFEAALQLEKNNTKAINELYSIAAQALDYATLSALQWFLDEQVEEEKSMSDLLDMVKFAGTDKSAILVMNQQLLAQNASPRPADSSQ